MILLIVVSMAIKNGSSDFSDIKFWENINRVFKICINCLFKSILLKDTTGAEKIATSEYFSFLCNILTCSLSKINIDIIRAIDIENEFDSLETDLERFAFQMIKNIVLKKPFDDRHFELFLPLLDKDMETSNTPSEEEFDDAITLYNKCYLCYYENPGEDYNQTSLIFKEKNEMISPYKHKDIFEEDFDNDRAILAKPAVVLRALLNISQGDHEAVLYFLKEF